MSDTLDEGVYDESLGMESTHKANFFAMESTLQNLLIHLPRITGDSPADGNVSVDTMPHESGVGGGNADDGETVSNHQAQPKPITDEGASVADATFAESSADDVRKDDECPKFPEHPALPSPQTIIEAGFLPAGVLTDASVFSAPTVNAPADKKGPAGGRVLEDVFGDDDAPEDDRTAIDFTSIIPSDKLPNFTPHCRPDYRNKESLALRWFDELGVPAHRVRKINAKERESTMLTMLSIAKLLVLGGRVLPDQAGEYLYSEFERFATGLSTGWLSAKGSMSTAENSFRQCFKHPTRTDFPNVAYSTKGSAKSASIVEAFAIQSSPSHFVSTPEEREAFLAKAREIELEPSVTVTSTDGGLKTPAEFAQPAVPAEQPAAPVQLELASMSPAIEQLSITSAAHSVTLGTHDFALAENRKLINAQATELAALRDSVKTLVATVRTLESGLDKMKHAQEKDRAAMAELQDYTKTATPTDAVRVVLAKIEELSYRLASAEDTLSTQEPDPSENPESDDVPQPEAKPVAALARQEHPLIDQVIVYKRNYSTYEDLESDKVSKFDPPMTRKAFLDNYVRPIKTQGYVVKIDGSTASIVPQLFGIPVEFSPGNVRTFHLTRADFSEARKLAMRLPDFRDQYLREERAPAVCVNSQNVAAVPDAPVLIATLGTMESVRRRAADIKRHFDIQAFEHEQAFDTVQTAYGTALSYIEPRTTATGELGHLIQGKMTRPEAKATVAKAISTLVNVFRSKRALANFDTHMTRLRANTHVARMQATLMAGPVHGVLTALAAEFPARSDDAPALCDLLPTPDTYSRARNRTAGTAALASRDRSPNKSKSRS